MPKKKRKSLASLRRSARGKSTLQLFTEGWTGRGISEELGRGIKDIEKDIADARKKGKLIFSGGPVD